MAPYSQSSSQFQGPTPHCGTLSQKGGPAGRGGVGFKDLLWRRLYGLGEPLFSSSEVQEDPK